LNVNVIHLLKLQVENVLAFDKLAPQAKQPKQSQKAFKVFATSLII